jgi:hypothetical protein
MGNRVDDQKCAVDRLDRAFAFHPASLADPSRGAFRDSQPSRTVQLTPA